MIDFAREQALPTPLANSTLLPLLLLSLTRQKNAPSLTKTLNTILQEYDYIIVGAGSAGSTLAGRLSEIPCVNILLLEAGSTAPLLTDVPALYEPALDPDIGWNYVTTSQKHTGRFLKDRRIPITVGKGLGGSSLLNRMIYVRGNHENYNHWASQGARGWSYENVLPYFKKLEDNKDPWYLSNGYHETGGPITVETPDYVSEVKKHILKAAKELGYGVSDPNGATQTGFYNIQATMRQGQRCNTAKGYLVPAEKRKNLHILPNAFANKIIIQNRTAIGVLFEAGGKSYTVKAKNEVILSAGTINTAQLLMLSGIGPKVELQKHGIEEVVDLPVGYNYHDHCTVISIYELDSNIPTRLELLTNRNNIMNYIQNRIGPLASPSLHAIAAFLKSNFTKSELDDPDCQIFFRENVYQSDSASPKSDKDETHSPHTKKQTYMCGATYPTPKSRGTVKLQSSNPHDAPIIDPNFFAHPEDIKHTKECLKTCHQIATSEAMKKLGSKLHNSSYPGCDQFLQNEDLEEYFECIARSFVKPGCHHVGTAKMGDFKDPTTVVDPYLRVNGVKGIRVVDGSVMPTITSGNTNIPVIMIAEKASDIIKDTIKCK